MQKSEFSELIKTYKQSQGGQSRGQHDGVHGFHEPVKSLTTFVMLSQSAKKPSYFSAQDCVKVSPKFAVVSLRLP